jgi:hypothetical protein
MKGLREHVLPTRAKSTFGFRLAFQFRILPQEAVPVDNSPPLTFINRRVPVMLSTGP